MYAIVWEYEVGPEHAAAFEALYGAGLYRDTARPMLYLTIDRWLSRAAYEAFARAAGPAYAALDRRGDALTVREHRLGAFDG